jgi:hypothetical protein
MVRATHQPSANDLEELLALAVQFHVRSAEEAAAVRAAIAAVSDPCDSLFTPGLPL